MYSNSTVPMETGGFYISINMETARGAFNESWLERCLQRLVMETSVGPLDIVSWSPMRVAASGDDILLLLGLSILIEYNSFHGDNILRPCEAHAAMLEVLRRFTSCEQIPPY